jgi:catechol 2,3-dioxygenase-like lactoylglutathione lyase family enzyme
MTNLNYVLLYVDNPRASAEYYEKLLGQPPLESHPTFVEFSLKNGLKLGLWSKHTAEPTPNFTGSSVEIAFTVKDKASVDSTYKDWTNFGLRVAQKPMNLDFGYTFVLLDPDGHRLRVFCLNG